MFTVAVAISMSATAQFQYLGYGNDDERLLATQAPYVTDIAITPAYVPQIGREYHGLVWRKGVPVDLRAWGSPGPTAYGARQDDYSLYYARVGNVVVSASPWIRVHDNSSKQRLERARQAWLREQGYTETPRVFRNPIHYTTSHANANGLMERYNWNKITIPVPTRPRFEVNAGDSNQPRPAPRVVVARAGSGRIVVGGRSTNATTVSRAD